MRRQISRSFAAWFSTMLLSSNIFAQTYTTVNAENSSHFKVGNHHYDFSIGGLREYVDSLKGKEPALYAKLDKNLSELESSREKGIWITLGGLSAGLTLVIIGLARGTGEKSDGTVPATTILGFGLMAVAPIGLLSMPGRNDYLRFINKHNDMDPPSPINIQIGLAPAPGGGQGWLTATF